MTESRLLEGVAIVGLAGRFPGAGDVDQFWGNLVEGKECITDFTVDQLVAEGVPLEVAERRDYVRRAPVIDDPAGFDARLFNYSPKEAELIDPQQRILLECAFEAMWNAGHDPHRFPGLVGIWAGSGVNNYFLKNLLSRPGGFEAIADVQTIIGNDKDYLASRIAYKLNLRGPAVVVQTACSTGLVAVHSACMALLTYQCDMALAGGVFLQSPRAHGYIYKEGEIFSPDGRCRAFDKGANGTVLGEGCGLVVLRRLEDAVKDRDNILAVIRGSAVNNDGGARAGYTAPGVSGQLGVLTMAHAVAGVDAAEIGYIEAHGTGTLLGDPIELSALTQAFRRTTEERGYCGIGSVKTNIGHLDVAAGIAGLIKTVCALRHRQIPATLHFTEPNPELKLSESPFFVVDRLIDWHPRNGRRIAGVSSFGMGGTNAHVVLEEYTSTVATSPSRRGWQLLPFSAATGSALAETGKRISEFLKDPPAHDLADVSWTLANGRMQLRHRRCVVAKSTGDASTLLAQGGSAFVSEGVAPRGTPPVVALFSGQGTQYRGMGADLYRDEPIFRESMDRCSRILGPIGKAGSLLQILYGEDGELGALVNQTEVSQPALFALEYSLTRLWESFGVRPAAVLGHSIGEYVAACEAGIFTLEDGLSVVRERGRLMQSMPTGTMIAVPLPEAEVRKILPPDLDLSVINAPRISIVSGPTPGIEAFSKSLETQGIAARRLQTSHGFHSRSMEDAARAFESFLRNVRMKPPCIPIASNLSGDWMTPEQATDPAYWSKHLRNAVRFSDNLAIVARRFDSPVLLEIGPGNTLCAISGQNEEPVSTLRMVSSVRHSTLNANDQAFFLRALGGIWCHGVPVRFDALHSGESRARIALPGYPFERQRFWIEMAQGTVFSVAVKEGTFRWWRRSRKEASENATEPVDEGSVVRKRPVDEVLTQIWCKVLGTQSVGPDDNFFDLGGHSLMAVQIMVELEKLLGIRFPLAMLIEAPTIRQLSRLVESRKSGSSWTSLVPLHTSGSKPPFFLMHSHGGNILEYQHLARLLKDDRPIYALQCRGLDGSPVQETDVEEMAAQYLAEIRTVQPKGPYFLGGYCFGGYLSLEIAHRLREANEEVGLVVLINSGTYLFPRYPAGSGRLHRYWHALRYRLALELDELSGKPFEKKMLRLTSRAKRLADLVRAGAERWSDRLPGRARSEGGGHSLIYHLEKLADANDRAWSRYRPKPYAGKTLFLRARVQPFGIDPDPMLGWSGLLTGELIVKEVPGFRQNLLDEPNVLRLAEFIMEAI